MAEEPVFYFDNRSPPVRSVRMLLNALDVKFEEKLIDLFKGEHQTPNFLKVSDKLARSTTHAVSNNDRSMAVIR